MYAEENASNPGTVQVKSEAFTGLLGVEPLVLMEVRPIVYWAKVTWYHRGCWPRGRYFLN